MTAQHSRVRRRVLRPPRNATDQARRQRNLSARRAQLEKDQQCLARWMTKLRRAFHAVEKQQRKVARLEREIAKLDALPSGPA